MPKKILTNSYLRKTAGWSTRERELCGLVDVERRGGSKELKHPEGRVEQHPESCKRQESKHEIANTRRRSLPKGVDVGAEVA